MKMISILQSLQQGIVICDRLGRVSYMNDAYLDFMKITREEAYGKKLQDIRVNSLVPKVLNSRQAIEGIYKNDGFRSYFANIYPLIEEDELKGTISIITTMEQSKEQKKSLGKTLKERVAEFEKKEILDMILIYGDSVEAKKKIAGELDMSLASLYAKIQ